MQHPSRVISYITTQQATQKLFREPLFSLGILRLLDDTTTKLVLSLLADTIHISRIEEIPSCRESLQLLMQMKLVILNSEFVSLSESFRDSLVAAFNDPPKSLNLELVTRMEDRAPTRDDTSEGVCDNFQEFLNYLVNGNMEPPKKIRKLLISAELIDEYGNITNRGFEFLLQNRVEQQWHIVLCAIKFFSRSLEDELNMFYFIVELTVIKDGSICMLNEWTEWDSFLGQIGVFRRVNLPEECVILNNRYFFSSLSTRTPRDLFLVLETNFKIYAYTSSLYEQSILNLFSKTLYILPGLIKAQFDEGTARIAFERGISSAQIIRYLQEHSSDVPQNVLNQLVIWEKKLNRMKESRGILYSDFNHLSDYISLYRMLSASDGILYCNEYKRIIIAKDSMHQRVKEFLKSL